MAATITNEDIRVFNVSNKFGFLDISDSDEDGEKIWLRAKKANKQSTQAQNNSNNKKKNKNSSSSCAPGSVVGHNTAPAQNIINPPTQGGGLSKNAKRRAKKKAQAEAAKEAEESAAAATLIPQVPATLTQEEIFQRQLDEVMRISKAESELKEEHVQNGDAAPKKKKKKKTKAEETPPPVAEETPTPDSQGEEEEDDLFVPVIEDIKDVMKKIVKEDEIPITEIPIDNNQLLRKRALELQDINSEFKLKLNGLLRVGYKYKKKYDKEKSKNRQLNKVIHRCESSKKTAELVSDILQHEETEQMLTSQIEQLSEELERERTKLYTLQNKAYKKVSFSEKSETT